MFRERLLSRLDAATGEGSRGVSVPALSDNQLAQLEAYLFLIRRWNRRINLTSLPLEGLADQTIDRLFVEPLCAARFLNGHTGAVGRTLSGQPVGIASEQPPSDVELLRWADLGSGGGSPAIPLKIVCPSTHLTMVESRDRKAAFLREAVREMALPDVEVASVRAEELPAAGVFGAITVRAVRLDSSFLSAVRGLLTAHGRLILFLAERADWSSTEFELIDGAVVGNTVSRIAVLSKRSIA